MNTTSLNDNISAKLLFGLSIFVFAFYGIGYLLGDIYKYAIVGAIYELLWLPMLLCLIAIPVCSIVLIIKNKAKSAIYAVLAILITLCAFLIMITR